MSVPLVVMGASLGGFDALSVVLGALRPGFPAAVAVAQHRAAGGETSLADLLDGRCALPVRDAEDKDPITAGHVYLAPADYHLLVDGDHLSLTIDEPVSWARPSIDVLFESAAGSVRRNLIAVLLTAASEDGARGIEAVGRAGGVTIVQDPDEARSDVAPRAALARGSVDHVLKLQDIPSRLLRVLGGATA